MIRALEPTPLVSTEQVESRTAIPAGPRGAGEASFGDVLMHAVEDASRADATATQKAQALAAGAIDDLHGTMISVKEADIAVKLVGTVRNKILDAFQELWRTSV